MIRVLMFLTGVALIAMAMLWLVSGFIGMVGGLFPWLLVAIIVWRVSLWFRPRRSRWEHRRFRDWERTRREQPRWNQAAAHPEPAQANRLPLDVEMKAAQVRRKVEVLEKHASEFPFASEQLYIVRAIASDYLPHTLQTYMALPPLGRDKAVVSAGKTALQEVRDQLTLLDTKLDEIAEDLERRNLDRLLANRRFLEERFHVEVDKAAAM